ncbi:Uncharacterised protein [uncultured Roseburia sp.]|uniref:Uncharacterized protein n=1 Tax=Brotonthovivens ammoniilytica TaxID=2981725 RepID=A0ABT2TK43_9FIRM|nr:hypothetical protein [Brotonthovivens ammoniilytica]MCU6762477.1 hypothetical protein [Brotonthovivens ammoniilytica]SCI73054.1 Uncharacterised protein [uncultured Roseburia sp.]
MKKFLKAVLALGIIGYIGYKVYKYFTKEPEYQEFDDNTDGVEFDVEAEAEESLADKIKAAAKKITG